MAKAHSSIVEIFMTDLCFEDGAEGKCEEHVGAALAVDPESLDAMQVLASLRLSQSRPADAAVIMETVFGRVSAIREAVQSRTVIEEIIGAPDLVDIAGNYCNIDWCF